MTARHHTRLDYARMCTQFARGFALLVLALTVVALYLDLSRDIALRRQQRLMVVVRQTRDLVVFEASERRWPFPWESRSSDIGVLRVIEWVEGTTLWEIETTRPLRVSVTYGEVPTGFTQTIPSSGVPAPLRPGASYGVTVRGTGGSAVATFNKLLAKITG